MDVKIPEPSAERQSWWPVLLVVLLALSLRVWVVARSEVPARDSIGFIKFALRYESEPFAQVVRESEQPPGYPLAVLVASWPVRAFTGGVTPHTMALSAQIASAFFGTLLVLPMIGLGTELVNRRFGLIAAVFFQALPTWIKLTSDGLSESMFLFFVALGLWLAARALRTQCVWNFVGCGLATGCAFLTRPEGAELVPVVLLVLCGLWLTRQIPMRRASLYATALIAGFLVFMGPFVAITGRLTNKPTAKFLLGDKSAEKSYFNVGQNPPFAHLPLAVWWQGQADRHKNRLIWATEALITEVLWSSRQIGFALSIIGLFFWPTRIRNAPGGWVLMLLSALHACLLIKMTSSIGYLSERHTALIVLTGTYPATLGLFVLIEKLAALSWNTYKFAPATIVMVIAVVSVLTGLPSLRKPLHYNRTGHRKAGEWLAHHAPPDSGICDPFCWAQYYAGRDFVRAADNDPPDQFVVLETSDNQHSRLPLIPEAKAKAAAGELVYYWPERNGPSKAQVAVYRWHRTATFTPAIPNSTSMSKADDGSDRIAVVSP